MTTGNDLPRVERRLAIAAFLSLFGILCAQSLLETARDTLLLTYGQVGRLPWLYLAVAALTLAITGVSPGGGRRFRSRLVPLSLLVGALVTAGLGVALTRSNLTAVYVLFLWSGIYAAFTVTRVWTVLAEALDMSSAKRLYGRLAAGGGLGAVAGAGAARLLSGRSEPYHLVLLAAAIAAATAIGPAVALRGPANRESVKASRTAAPSARPARLVEHPYVARLMAMTLLAAAVSTLLDYSFKETLAAHVPIDRLPHFFATFHLVTSLISLLVQVFGVALLVRTVGVGRVQVVLPLVLLVGVAATISTGGLALVVLLRGLDVALRGSFQRPTFELLQVPLGERLRRKVKPLIDAFGLRGGQATAGIGLLLMARLAAGPVTRLAVVAVLLVVWLAIALGLGRRYVDLLRSTLLQPDLTKSSDGRVHMEGAVRATLVGALESPREAEVQAALDLLVAYGLARLIPPRLLDHPSPTVVRRVVEMLPVETTGHTISDLLAALDALLGHADVTVRKAALRRRSALAPDRARLSALARQSTCATSRGIALVILVDQGWDEPGQTLADLRAVVEDGDRDVRLSVAEAIADRPSRRFENVLLGLAGASEAEVLGPVAASLGAMGGDAAVTTLVTLLGKRQARGAARAALTSMGAPGFDIVAAALADSGQPMGVRANVPRALVEIDPERSLGVLLDGLLVEEDGFVRFRILRALNRVRRVRPKMEMDEDILGRAAVTATDSAYRYLAWRIFLEDGASRSPERRTPTWALLRDLLDEKEQNAVERLFRILTLRYPHEDFRKLLRALRVGGRRERAAGRELIENLLSGPAQALTLALIDDASDRERLSAMEKGNPAARRPRAPIYRDLLSAICVAEDGGTLAALAAHHAAELTERTEPTQPRRPMAAHG